MEVEQFEIPLQDNLDIEVISENEGSGCSKPILNQVVEEQHDEERGDTLGILRKALLAGYEALKIPSLSGMNSLIASPVSNLELTNVFSPLLIPGLASDYSAICIALKVAHGIST